MLGSFSFSGGQNSPLVIINSHVESYKAISALLNILTLEASAQMSSTAL